MGTQPDSSARALGRIRRQLAALDIRTQLSPRGDLLTGELLPGDAVMNPLNGEPLARVTFKVASDATLEAESPPLVAGLRIADCSRCSSEGMLFEQLNQALHRRVAEVQALHNRVEALGLEPEMDVERAEVAVSVDLDTTGQAVLVGDDRGLVARYVFPVGGKRAPVSLGDLVLDLAGLSDKVDLELFLAARAGEVLAERGSAGAPSAVAGDAGPVARASPKELTLAELGERLSPSAVVGSGFSVVRNLMISGDEVRFEACHRGDDAFVARLHRCGKGVWEGSFRLSRISSLDDFIAELVAGRSPWAAEGPIQKRSTDERARLVAGLLPPAPGEIWVMDVSLEDDDGQEVRYRGLGTGGQSYGAPRVLAKAAFEATFAKAGVGYRLLVRVLEVGEDYVEYQRLDAERKPVASPRRSPLIIFMASFAAEAAAC
jgi:hypothetical protein